MESQANVASAQGKLRAVVWANLQRGQTLIPSGAISKQDLEQRTADSSNKMGLAKAAQADLDRMRVLEKLQADRRAVRRAGDDTLDPRWRVDQCRRKRRAATVRGCPKVTRLRVYVNVPQNYVPRLKVGTQGEADVVPGDPGRELHGAVEGVSAVGRSVGSGTTRMQLVVDNTSGELMTGAFVNLSLGLESPCSDTVDLNIPVERAYF